MVYLLSVALSLPPPHHRHKLLQFKVRSFRPSLSHEAYRHAGGERKGEDLMKKEKLNKKFYGKAL
jgi:hypothetical protein